ncbi:LPD1 domain-containing protein [Paraburkholderia sp. BR10872]|uniref:LPD1 domain-containing protein n=1 Tax=Paraburkholderia sp. BR10872 TaxID=3236989 RepID=UPI0034D2F020
MLIAMQCPPDGRNRLVVRGYTRSNLAAFGFEEVAKGTWLADRPAFKLSELKSWFPGFDPARDVRDIDVDSFLIGYEDLNLLGDDGLIGALLDRHLEEEARRNTTAAASSAAVTTAPSHEQWVAGVRRNAPREALATVLSGFAVEDENRVFRAEIDERTRSHFLNEAGLTGLGRGFDVYERAAALRGSLGQELSESIARYNALRQRGLDAVSDYDLGIVYGGDPVVALRQNLLLSQANIDYVRRRMQVFHELAEELAGPDVGADDLHADEPVAQPQIASPQQDVPVEGGAAEAGVHVPRLRPVKSEARQRQRIEDAGEKIGGARKDYYARALARVDLDGMNEREKVKLVTKDNIWPGKSLEDFQKEGQDVNVALFVTQLRRECPPSIAKAEHAEAYVDLVTRLRDICAELEDIAQVRESRWEAKAGTFVNRLQDAGIIEVEVREYGGRQSKSMSLADAYQELLNRDSRTRKFMFDFIYEPDRGYRRAIKAYSGKAVKVNDEWQNVRDLDSDGIYAYLAGRKAEASARRQRTISARAEAEGDESKVDYLSRPHLDHIQRVGLPDERNGRDISPDDFLTTFGFRACEFGNWLPDIERQDVLNRAYDALSTLSRVLGVDRPFLSLGGTLAVAFGARGVGRAAAHYEPTRKVINLTRLNGAGSLAHEWFHAFDDHLGAHVKALVAASRYEGHVNYSYFATDAFLTRKREGRRHDNREIAQQRYIPADLKDRLMPLVNAVNALTVRRLTDEELQALADRNVGVLRHNVAGWLRNVLGYVAPEMASEERMAQAAAYEAAVYEEMTTGSVQGWRPGPRHHVVERLADMFEQGAAKDLTREQVAYVKQCLNGLEDNLKRLPAGIQQASDLDALRNSREGTGLVNTDYFKAGEALDKGRSPKYWSSVIELAARAFESYVQDRCASLGWRDDYLVHGTQGLRFAEAKHSPYPVGHERERTNCALAELMAMARQEFAHGIEHTHADTVSHSRPKAA